MLRVMVHYNIQQPFPAHIDYIKSALDRKYTDYYKNAKTKKRSPDEDQGKFCIVLLNFWLTWNVIVGDQATTEEGNEFTIITSKSYKKQRTLNIEDDDDEGEEDNHEREDDDDDDD